MAAFRSITGLDECGPGQVFPRRLGDGGEQVEVQAGRFHRVEGLVRTGQRVRRRGDLERRVGLSHDVVARLHRRRMPERIVRGNGTRGEDVLQILRLDRRAQHRALQPGLAGGDPGRQVGAFVACSDSGQTVAPVPTATTSLTPACWKRWAMSALAGWSPPGRPVAHRPLHSGRRARRATSQAYTTLSSAPSVSAPAKTPTFLPLKTPCWARTASWSGS